MRVLMITQKLDKTDPVLSYTLRWIQALSKRVEHVHVLCLERHLETFDELFPANVTTWSMGKENGVGRLREFVAYYRVLSQVIGQIDVIFSYMVPRYALLAVPLAKPRRIPVGLWYTHPTADRELRLAVALLDWIATAFLDRFPLPGAKVHEIGQGADVSQFYTEGAPKDDPPLIVTVGRLSPMKHHETLLDAASLLRDRYGNPPCRFVVAGDVMPNSPAGYRDTLLSRRETLHLSPEQFDFPGAIPSEAVSQLYQRATLSTNLMPAGSFDKAALEAMVSGLPVIGVNPAFIPIWGEHAACLQLERSDDAVQLAERLSTLLQMPRIERERIGADLQKRAITLHSLDGQMDRLVAVMASSLRR